MILAIYASLCYNRERLWEYMGAGVPRGLQNRCGGLGTSQVGSIPTYSRQKGRLIGRPFFIAFSVDKAEFFGYYNLNLHD